MSEIRCVRVDPPAKPSRWDVIGAAIKWIGCSSQLAATLADRIENDLVEWEADNPEPTYRIELDAEAFESLAHAQMSPALILDLPASLWAIIRAAKGCSDTGAGYTEIGPEPPDEGRSSARFFPEHVAAFQPKVRAKVTNIGTANPVTHEARFWVMEGGDYAGLDTRTGLLGGWNIHELAAIAERAKVIGTHGAVNEANQRRRLPPEVLPCCVSIPWAEVLAEAEDNQ